jgi:hypothetical protein
MGYIVINTMLGNLVKHMEKKHKAAQQQEQQQQQQQPKA